MWSGDRSGTASVTRPADLIGKRCFEEPVNVRLRLQQLLNVRLFFLLFSGDVVKTTEDVIFRARAPGKDQFQFANPTKRSVGALDSIFQFQWLQRRSAGS